MRVETSAGSYFIDWKHIPVEVEIKKISHITECLIKSETNIPITTNSAFCSGKDNFCREKGRKISLSRAVMFFDKQVRTEIWKAYLNRKVKDANPSET